MSKEAKDKAEELIEFYYYLLPMLNSYEEAILISKKCALICVNEIIKTNPSIDVRITKNNSSWIESISDIDFWEEVKQEILNRQ